jgi:hypothetical protein
LLAFYTFTDHRTHARTLAEFAVQAGRAGDRSRALRLADEAEALARTCSGTDAQDPIFAELSTAVADAGDLNRAEALALAIAKPEVQAQALAELAVQAGRAGDRSRALRLADEAEGHARAITDPNAQAWALAELATSAARLGDLDRTRNLLALALTAEPPEPEWVIKTVSSIFPSIIKDACDVFLNAYQTIA